MPEGYNFQFSDLEEYFVDYVDGSMDPKVSEAFEEYLRTNQEASVQIAELLRVRTQLCSLGEKCQCVAPEGFQSRLHSRLNEQIDCDNILTTSALSQVTPGLNVVARSMSLLLVLIAIGMCWPNSDQQNKSSAYIDELGPYFLDNKAPYKNSGLEMGESYQMLISHLNTGHSTQVYPTKLVTDHTSNMTIKPKLLLLETKVSN